MKTLLLAAGSMILASTLACAESFTGTLVDQNCVQQQEKQQPQQPMSCTPTAATTSFAVTVQGKNYKLDDSGNKKAAEAFKKYNSSADRERNPNAAPSPISATVVGTMKDDEIKVETIDVH